MAYDTKRLRKMTKEQLLALFNRCELDKNGEFWYEGPDGELMTAIENELDLRMGLGITR
jgi:hypothetical protein